MSKERMTAEEIAQWVVDVRRKTAPHEVSDEVVRTSVVMHVKTLLEAHLSQPKALSDDEAHAMADRYSLSEVGVQGDRLTKYKAYLDGLLTGIDHQPKQTEALPDWQIKKIEDVFRVTNNNWVNKSRKAGGSAYQRAFDKSWGYLKAYLQSKH